MPVSTFLAVICAKALVATRADVPRRHWGGRIVLNKLGGVVRGLAAASLDCASCRNSPGTGATYALTERQLQALPLPPMYRVYTDRVCV